MHSRMLLGHLAVCALMAAGPSIAYAAEGGGGGGRKAPESAAAPTPDPRIAELEKELGEANAKGDELATKLVEADKAREAAETAAREAAEATEAANAEVARLRDELDAREAAAAEATEAAADVAGVARMRHFDGATSASCGGFTYQVDDAGYIAVPLSAVADLESHGWELARA